MRKPLTGRQLTTYVGAIINNWASDVLGLPLFDHQTGKHAKIDLLGEHVGVEVKSRNRKYTQRWAVHNHQFDEFPQKHANHDLYYAFVLYSMKPTANEIFTHDMREISRHMTKREMWVVPWSFLENFDVSSTNSGKYRYPYVDDFPNGKFFSEYWYGQSLVYIPKNSSIESHLEELNT